MGSQLQHSDKSSPELLYRNSRHHRLECYDEDLIPDLSGATDWDVATRYTEFSVSLTRGTASESNAQTLRRVAAREIIRRAQQVLGSITHPTTRKIAPWTELPEYADRIEMDIEETLENAPLFTAGSDIDSSNNTINTINTINTMLLPEDVWMQYDLHRQQPLVLCLDTSLSMMGENLALMAIAVAVVVLELPDDPIGVLGFDDEPQVLKHPGEKVGVQELVERLLDVPGRPYTNIEVGLREALKLVRFCGRGSYSQPVSTVLLTDGKYTAGADPAYLAAYFEHLVVLKIGQAQAGCDLCHDMAKRGKGQMQEVPRLAALPMVMYQVIQDLLRGYSHC